MFDVAAWSNEPELPAVSAADAGKVLAVGENGEIIAEMIASSSYYHFIRMSFTGVGAVVLYAWTLIKNDDPTPFTLDTLRSWLDANGYTSSNKYMLVWGTGVLYKGGTTQGYYACEGSIFNAIHKESTDVVASIGRGVIKFKSDGTVDAYNSGNSNATINATGVTDFVL